MNIRIHTFAVSLIASVLLSILPPQGAGAMEATPTPAPTARRPKARSSDIQNGVIYTTNTLGDIYTQGSKFSLDVALRENTTAPPRTYFFRVYYDSDFLKLDSGTNLELKAGAVSFGNITGTGPDTYRNVSAFPGDRANTKMNPNMVRLNFTVVNEPTRPHSVRLALGPPNPAIITTTGVNMITDFDSSATDPFAQTISCRSASFMLLLQDPFVLAGGHDFCDSNGDGLLDVADWLYRPIPTRQVAFARPTLLNISRLSAPVRPFPLAIFPSP